MREGTVESACRYFKSGLNCAESSLRALLECFDGKLTNSVYKVATPFGGGLGV